MKKNPKNNKSKAADITTSTGFVFSEKIYWAILGVLLLFVMGVRLRLADFPLERDEGEYAYFGQLILKGIPPYQMAYNMKFPGTYFMYALQMGIFGQTTTGIHLGLMLVNMATIVLLFSWLKRLISVKAAMVGSAAFAILALSPTVLGFAAHATNYVALWAIAGALVLSYAIEKDKLLWYMGAGFLLGMAYIMKQSGAFFVVFGGLALICNYIFSKARPGWAKMMMNAIGYGIGGLLPFFLMVLAMKMMGVFDKFWFWTFTYASAYGSQVPWSKALEYFNMSFIPMFEAYPIIWIMILGGLVALFFSSLSRQKIVIIILFFVFSFLTICPGLYFRSHYFVTLLPAAGVLVAVLVDFLDKKLMSKFSPSMKFVSVVLFVLAALTGISKESDYLFKTNTAKLCSQSYSPNPFNEAIKIAKYINANSNDTDKVSVLGSEPEIYFYAKRFSASGYIYTYNLMEKHDYSLTMQKEMISEVEKNNPKFLVLVNVPFSWLRHEDSESFIFGWIDQYVSKNYELCGIADILSSTQTAYIWDEELRNYKVKSKYFVNVFRRKAAPAATPAALPNP